VYLNYLRHALYTNMIEADVAIDRARADQNPLPRIETLDLDACGLEEGILSDEHLCAIVKPSAGASVIALDVRPKRFNLLNTFARRPEAYHLLKHEGASDANGVPSIHDLHKDIGRFSKDLIYDTEPRSAFQDYAFTEEPDWRALPDDQSQALLTPSSVRYHITGEKIAAKRAALIMEASARIPSGGVLALSKKLTIEHGGKLRMNYRLRREKGSHPPTWFATAFNFTLLAGHDSDRFYQWADVKPGSVLLDAREVLEGIHEIDLVDRAFGFRVKLTAHAERLSLAPVETISQSESGFDKLYQGSTVWIGWRPKWSREGIAEFEINVTVELS
jgi:alpha-amylase